jgi:integrase
MGRPANPIPTWNEDRKVWVVRVTLPKPAGWPRGKEAPRESVDLSPQIGPGAFELAKTVAKGVSDAKRRPPTVTADGSESCSDYFGRLATHRAELGRRGGAKDRSAWNKWIAPYIGHLPIGKVTRDDVEAVRDALDAAIREHARTMRKKGVGGKRARNIWTVLVTTFKAATTAKRKDLRVRSDNPCVGVLPPEKGTSRSRTFVYPVEMVKLLSCKDVPLEWRELYAIAYYLYLRPGELRVLTFGDLDFDAGVAHVTKAYDEDRKETKGPKSGAGTRDVPIHPNLRPLLEAMRGPETKRKRPNALVVPLMGERSPFERARTFRGHLEVAKCDRPRLTADNPREEPVDFRSLRDSGITALVLSKVDIVKAQRRAGHEEISTTLGYVKMAEDINGNVGEPFPPLPTPLLEFRIKRGGFGWRTAKSSAKTASPEGFEPSLAT